MAIEIIGKEDDVKRYRKILHDRGSYTKRFKADIDSGLMLSKPDDFMVAKASFSIMKSADYTDTQDRTDDKNEPPPLMKIIGVANENAVDRMDERLDPRGVTIDNFRKNPVLLADHMYMTRAVIGRVENVTPEDDGVKFVANLGDPDKADLTVTQMEVRSLIKQGLLQTVSVGFIPKKIRAPEFDGEGRLTSPPIILEWELLEISVVAVPANPGSTFEMRDLAKRLAYMTDLSHTNTQTDVKGLTATKDLVQNIDNQSQKDDNDHGMEAEDMEELKELLTKLLAIAEEQKTLILGQTEILKEFGAKAKPKEEDDDCKGKPNDDDKKPKDDDDMKSVVSELRSMAEKNAKAIDDIATVLKSILDKG